MAHPFSGAGRPKYELAAIVRAHGDELKCSTSLRPEQARALKAIELCRTAALGGHLDRCVDCGFERPAYNSCRNRHCPKCQGLAQEQWISARTERVLPIGHFHIVFTLPSELYPLVAFRRESMLGVLMRTAAETLSELGRSKLGVRLGITEVLHTWNRELGFHPHVHCVVTAGGLTLDDSSFISKEKFLFPVKVLGALFRGKMMAAIRRLHRDHTFAGFDDFRDPLGFDALMQRVAKHAWVVYSKAPFASSRHVFEYLGRYTHRVGIANSRLLAFEDGKVTFATKNGATKTLAGVDFLRRFVAHVLPPGFVKIRHYALYAGVNVHTRLSRAHLLLRPADVAPSAPRPPASYIELLLALIGRDVRRCRQCGGEVLAKGLLASVVTRPANAARAPP